MSTATKRRTKEVPRGRKWQYRPPKPPPIFVDVEEERRQAVLDQYRRDQRDLRGPDDRD